MRKLIVQQGERPQVFPVRAGLTIGREAGNTIRLEGRKVEDRHAKISIIGPYVFIEDLDTDGGTWVKGKKIRRVALNKGDTIEVGGTKLTYDEDDRPEPSAKPKPKPKAAANQAPSASRSGPPPKSSHSQRIRISGLAAAGKASPASGPPAASGAKPGSSVRLRKPGSSVRVNKPGSSVRVHKSGSSIRAKAGPKGARPGQTGFIKSLDRAQLEEAALQASHSARTQAPRPIKMTRTGLLGMALLLAVPVLAVLAVPQWKQWRQHAAARAEAERLDREALERLRSPDAKRTEDLRRIIPRLKETHSWKKLTELLGEPHLEFDENVKLWDAARGSYTYEGLDLRLYFIKDKNGSWEDESAAVVPCLLFASDEDDHVIFVGNRFYARRDAPPAGGGEETSARKTGQEPSASGTRNGHHEPEMATREPSVEPSGAYMLQPATAPKPAEMPGEKLPPKSAEKELPPAPGEDLPLPPKDTGKAPPPVPEGAAPVGPPAQLPESEPAPPLE